VGLFLLSRYDSTYLFVLVNQHHSPILDQWIQVLNKMGEAWIIATVLFVLLLFKPFRTVWYVLMSIAATILPSLMTQLIKLYYEAPRPLTVYHQQSWVHHLSDWPYLYHHSFPSGHTTGAFSFFCLLSCLLSSSYRFWAFLFFLLALSVAYARLYMAAHFFIDVYVGSIIGTFISWLSFGVVLAVKNKNEVF
jgi:membrane-associated phospholipid phosphatase